MSITTSERNNAVTDMLNSTLVSLKSVIPMEHQAMKPQLMESQVPLTFGVLIGIIGDMKAKLVIAGQRTTFGSIGKEMFGMPLEGEMLQSFAGELGNMIAGGLSTNISKNGTNINITSPTIMQGETILSGFKQAIEVPVAFENMDNMHIYLLLD